MTVKQCSQSLKWRLGQCEACGCAMVLSVDVYWFVGPWILWLWLVRWFKASSDGVCDVRICEVVF